MSSRSMFRARSAIEMFSTPLTSSAMSASPRVEVEVEQGDGVGRIGGQSGGEVHRQRRGPDSAARAEHRDRSIDDPVWRAVVRRCVTLGSYRCSPRPAATRQACLPARPGASGSTSPPSGATEAEPGDRG